MKNNYYGSLGIKVFLSKNGKEFYPYSCFTSHNFVPVNNENIHLYVKRFERIHQLQIYELNKSYNIKTISEMFKYHMHGFSFYWPIVQDIDRLTKILETQIDCIHETLSTILPQYRDRKILKTNGYKEHYLLIQLEDNPIQTFVDKNTSQGRIPKMKLLKLLGTRELIKI